MKQVNVGGIFYFHCTEAFKFVLKYFILEVDVSEPEK